MSDAQILHIFSGKGGVGKTTLSAAYAFTLAEKFPKESVLLVSLDGSGALSELVGKKLSSKPSKLQAGKGSAGLYAAELDDAAVTQAFLKKYVPALESAVLKGQVLSAEDLRKLLGASTAGVEELASLLHLQTLLEGKDFDRLVVDAPSTSHMLRLFDSPQHMRKFLGHVRGTAKARKEPLGGFLEELEGRLESLNQLLRDPARTAFHLLSLAEPVPELQTRHLFAALRERNIPVAEVVTNQVEDRSGCGACAGRRGLQAPHVRKFQALDKGVPVVLLQKREVAPRGAEALKKLASEWAAGKETKALEFAAAEGPPALVRAPSMPPIAAPPLPPTRLIFFVGQGGTGKSSCAAAAAVTLTEKEGPVLLLSTDSSHSLSEVLQSKLTDTETQVKGTKGLYARELDIGGWFNALRKRIREKAERAFEGQGKGGEIAYDREILRNLLDTAPANLDELAAMSVLTDALIQERFKRIVVDGAPMGGTLRLLELPELAKGWLKAVHGVVSKHAGKGLKDLAEELAGMIKHVERFEAALTSPNEARFVVVTRGEEFATARTEAVVDYLKSKKVVVERVLVNRVPPKADCPKCEARRTAELQAAKNIEKKIGSPITLAPALGRHPAGLRELKAFRTAWYALTASAKIKAA